MTDLDRLYAALVAHPDEDMPRLAYADELDAQDETRPECGACAGSGWEAGRVGYERCGECLGVPLPVCTANRDRAEFIRVQCELARTPDPECLHCWEGNGCVYHALQRRESALLKDHPEWRPVCPVCNPDGNRRNTGQPCCGGPGRVPLAGSFAPISARSAGGFEAAFADWPLPAVTCGFRRGFLYSVMVPTLATLMQYFPELDDEGDDWKPTPWAASLPKTVRRVYCEDREPVVLGLLSGSTPVDRFGWWRFTVESAPSSFSIPETIWNRLEGFGTFALNFRHYTTAEAARDALAEAVADFIRGTP